MNAYLNPFNLRITTKQHLDQLGADKASAERNAAQATRLLKESSDLLTKARNELADSDRARGEQLKRIQELDGLLSKSKSDSADANSKLTAQIDMNARAQSGRIEHNRVLHAVGQAWTNFKSTWQFRVDNPKMNPRDRTANNEALHNRISEIDSLLPKQIADPNIDVGASPVDDMGRKGPKLRERRAGDKYDPKN